MKAAFAKVGVALLVELGVHNPLAAEVGGNAESEMVLAKKLLDRLPENSLLICDRYYGVGAFLAVLVERFMKVPGAFLLRVRSNLKPAVIKALRDGSILVSVKIGKGKETTLVREIRGRVRRSSGKWVEVRFWTSLLDARKYPAKELLELYAKRWEQELMYREIKVDMRQAPLLKSHTVHTAAQEVAALVLAHALVAQSRMDAATEAGSEVMRISFGKTLVMVRSLWVVLSVGRGIIDSTKADELTKRVLSYIAEAILPPRRKRSCPRKVRQPVGSWPRLTENSYEIGEITYEIINAYA
jgi:putative transposase